MCEPTYSSIPDPWAMEITPPSHMHHVDTVCMEVDVLEPAMKPACAPGSPTSTINLLFTLPAPAPSIAPAPPTPYELMLKEPHILKLIALVQHDPAASVDWLLQQLSQVNPRLVQYVRQHPEAFSALLRDHIQPAAQASVAAPPPPAALSPPPPAPAQDPAAQRRARLIAHCRSCVDPSCATCRKVRGTIAQHKQQQQPQAQHLV